MRLSQRHSVVRKAGACLALALAVVALVGAWRTISPGDNPFTHIALDDPIGIYTADKLRDLQNDPTLCRRVLAESTLRYAPIRDRAEGPFCLFDNAVAITRSSVPYSAPLRVSCPLAAALYLWEREVLQPTAEEFLGVAVARVEHVGTYACRRVYGGRSGRPSQHASANAIDIIGYTLDDGRVVSVLKHYDEDDPMGAFLRALQSRSCGVFRGVLGPDYNDRHADHVHYDMGPYGICS